jgi:virginiamycin B lyase
MRTSRFSEARIVEILKELIAGAKAAGLCRKNVVRCFTIFSFLLLCSPVSASVRMYTVGGAREFIARPFVSAKITEYKIPKAKAGPLYIVAGPKKEADVWFTEYYDNTLAEISTTGVLTEHPLVQSPEFSGAGPVPTVIVPSKGSYPYGIAVGPDENVWFATSTSSEQFAGKLVGGKVDAYDASAACCIQNIVAGPDGALWYPVSNSLGNLGLNTINRITTAGKLTLSVSLPYASVPDIVTPGPDDTLWFTLSGSGQIGRITTKGVVTNLYAIPTANSAPYDIVLGPDGAFWFTEYGSSKIGRITTSGHITEYKTLTKNSGPAGITVGPDGAIWFVEFAGNKVGRITTAGAVEEFTIPTGGSEPYHITTGADKALWFTEFKGNKIGRLAIL